MPTAQHEALHRLFQEDPSLLGHTFRMLEIPFPDECAVSVINTDLTEIRPLERRADTLLHLKSALGEHYVIIESQTKQDEEKLRSWVYYLGYVYAKYGHDVILLVISQDAATARWARKPLTIGLQHRPSMIIYPLVYGPDNVPAITHLETAAQDVVLAVFSAITHGRSRSVGAILETLATALDTIDVDKAGFFAEFTEVGLGDTDARQLWRLLMSTKTYRYQSEFAQQLRAEGRLEGRVEGEARGEARSVLLLLERRGVPVTAAARERIEQCTDTALLDAWLIASLTAASVEELFAEE